ncbi:MAG: molybdenum cofactor guanylyltransferase [Pseudomonadota bacterium]
MGNKDSNTPLAPLFGLVLNGGGSRRMGRPKGDLTVGSESLRERARRTLRGVADPVWESVGDREVDAPYFVRDLRPGAGPLAGLHAAQEACPDAAWLVLAVDLPAVTPALLTRLVQARRADAAAVAFAGEEQFEPACAIYEPLSRPRVLEQIERGDYSLWRVLAAVNTVRLTHPGEALRNINTPDEWRRYCASGGGPQSA